MKKLMVAALAVCAVGVGFADHVAIPMLEKSAIQIDGDFSKPEYAVSSVFGGLVSMTRHRLVARDGDIYLAADRANLYVAAQWSVEGSETDGRFVTLAKQDGGPVWADDCVEIFVGSLGAETNCYQILLNSANARFETYTRNGKREKGWVSGAKSAARIAQGFWTMEVAIPWAALKGVDPKNFRFNLARNFVAAELGYASLTGQSGTFDPKQMISVRALEGFRGVKVFGFDTSLIAGRYRLTCEAEDVTAFASTCWQRNKNREEPRFDKLFDNDPTKEQSIPTDGDYKKVTASVAVKKFGKVYERGFLPFECGGEIAGGPVTDKRHIDGLGFSYTRRYSSATKVSVIVDGIAQGAKAVGELKSPDGHVFTATFAPLPDRTQKAIIKIPPEKTRAEGTWVGAVVVDGKRYENAFGFEEKKFPWTCNRIGYSNKILEPFTPIEFGGKVEKVGGGGQRILKTVLREHTLGEAGLPVQVKSLGEEIFAKPLTLELTAGGKTYEMKPDKWRVHQNTPHRVITEANGSFGPFRFSLTTFWDYDGFADVKVSLVPLAKDRMVERLTLKAPLKAEHASLFHALVDMPRGNPAGLIPTGTGKVWDSSTLIRSKSPKGLPWIPGEFTPYLWLGAEERGLALLFDSPKGYDLEDGKPMLRLIREGDVVTAEADIMNRAHEVDSRVEFGFAFEVTPVKPRMPGWKKWTFMWGQKFPDMINIDPCYSESAMGFIPGGRFDHQPDDTNKWMYARAVRKMLRTRHTDLDTLAHLATEGKREFLAWGMAHDDHLKRTYWGGGKRFTEQKMMYMESSLIWEPMTLDRIATYNCASIIGLTDTGYRYNKAEWATRTPYQPGLSDRIYLTPGTVDYLLWCYREMLRQGTDGINFDEQYVVPQTNPDLSEVRDYKGRCIPEMGIVAARKMYWRLANLLDEMGHKERLIVVHATNTMIIPEFAFASVCTLWEYGLTDVFQTQFPSDYVRAHSTGLQAGLVSSPLVLNEEPNRKQMGEEAFHKKRYHLFRTALAVTLQHGMWQHKRYWGDDSQAMDARHVFWMFGTHLDDCKFIPYWTKGKPFSVTDEKDYLAAKSTAPAPSFTVKPKLDPTAKPHFLVGAYQRDKTALFIVSNDGPQGKTTLMIDRKAMGIDEDAVMMDVYTGEVLTDGTVEIPDYEFKMIYVGPAEFGARLKPVPADRRFIIK